MAYISLGNVCVFKMVLREFVSYFTWLSIFPYYGTPMLN